MVKKEDATLEDIQRALKREMEKRLLKKREYLEDTPKVLREEDDEYLDDEKGTHTSRRRRPKGSGFLEEGTGSGSDTLNDRKLLDKIGRGEQDINQLRCETPPEFVESGVGYNEFMSSVKLQHQSQKSLKGMGFSVKSLQKMKSPGRGSNRSPYAHEDAL